MSVLDIAGVLLHTTPDRHAAMRAFYLDALGLKTRSDRPGFTNFEFGTQRLTISLHDGVTGPSRDAHRIMINFAVSDIEAAFERVVSYGAPVIRPPEPEAWGGLVATTADPDGNIIQLMELPD
ncbi:MAG TPA: VOC family protein [Acidimicrobiia bacterium]|jgi:predicted enzyme related to lactoylglutathione lyase